MAGHLFFDEKPLEQTNLKVFPVTITAPNYNLEPLAITVPAAIATKINTEHYPLITPCIAKLRPRQNAQDISNAVAAAVDRATVCA